MWFAGDAGGCVGTINEEKGAEKTGGEGREEDVAGRPVVGLDCGRVSGLHKDSKHHSWRAEKQKAVLARAIPSPQKSERSQTLGAAFSFTDVALSIETLHSVVFRWEE